MFELTNHKAKLLNVNVRTENNGDETKLAADLKIEILTSNDVLSEFDPYLKSALFKKAEENAQGELIDDPNYFPTPRFPAVSAIGWDSVLNNYEFTLHYGIGESDIQLSDCVVDKFKFMPQLGGSVEMIFRVVAHPKTSQLGLLCEQIQSHIEISLVNDV